MQLNRLAARAMVAAVILFGPHVQISAQDYSCDQVDFSNVKPLVDSATFQPGGSNYEVRTESKGKLAGSGPRDLHKFCMEFAATNMSAATVERFRWPFAGIARLSAFPGQKNLESKKVLYSCWQYVDDILSDVGAFRNERYTVITASPILPLDPRSHDLDVKCPIRADSTSEYFNISEALPQLSRSLSEAELHSGWMPAIEMTSEVREVSPLVSWFSMDDLSVEFRSMATHYAADGVVTVRNTAEVKSESGEVVIYSPWLKATEGTDFDSGDLEDNTATFLASLSGSGDGLLAEGAQYHSENTYRLESSPGQRSLFVVDFPVSVQAGDAQVCIIAQGYSLFPVSTADERYCRAVD